MATPKKLPSGNWRVRVYDYTDESGIKHYRSITADTKKKCALLAAEFDAEKNRIQRGDLTVGEAIDKYIAIKTPVLSQSTIRGYLAIRRNHFKDIEKYNVHVLTNTLVQSWINGLSIRLSPKTVCNAHGLLMAALDMQLPDMHIRVTLPARKSANLYVPSDNDVKVLLASIDDAALERAILLAAFGPMRRGEICALTADNISGSTVHVRCATVKDTSGNWIVKQPKTAGSYRSIEFPDFVIDKIKEPLSDDGRIVPINPDILTARFERALAKSGLHHFRFHDLRHYAASIMHAIGIPDQYIMQRGGWSTDGVMKSIYRGTIDEQTAKMTVKINEHFSEII